jgi:hypothetical protein
MNNAVPDLVVTSPLLKPADEAAARSRHSDPKISGRHERQG